jgi:hypothetical protein
MPNITSNYVLAKAEHIAILIIANMDNVNPRPRVDRSARTKTDIKSLDPNPRIRQ